MEGEAENASPDICDRCASIFRARQPWRFMYVSDLVLDNKGSGWGSHHRDFESFAKAVDQGCYICSVLNEAFSPAALEILRHFAAGETDRAMGWSAKMTEVGQEYPNFDVTLDTYTLKKQLKGLPKQSYVARFSLSRLTNLIPQVPASLVEKGSTDSTAAWNRASRWLEQCLRSHTRCGGGRDMEEGNKAWYPTRLLDLTSPDGTVRLIETEATTPRGPYVTLSHCWGTRGNILKTTAPVLETFKRKLPSTLPKTFDHAIVAARKLGVDYLWIDSLCIIQKDDAQDDSRDDNETEPSLNHKEDWERESALMHKVYQNALCNLAATASSDGEGGLFFDRPRIGRAQTNVSTMYTAIYAYPNPPVQPEVPERFWIIDDGQFRREVLDGPLLQRAWVHQERLLARRVLHFGHKQLFWECNELCASENYPSGLPPTVKGVRHEVSGELQELRSEPRSTQQQDPNASGGETAILDDKRVSVWINMVEMYTRSDLTVKSDKLTALSGIAKHLQPIFGDKYLAGLWKDNPHRYLAWYCDITDGNPLLLRSRPYRAPSWSWASTDNPVSFDTRESGSYKDDNHDSGVIYPLLTVVDASTEPATADPTGSVASGYIIVEGALSRLTLDKNGRDFEDGSTAEFDEPLESYVRPDQSIEVYALPLQEQQYTTRWVTALNRRTRSVTRLRFLLLQPCKEAPGCFVRVGLGTSVSGPAYSSLTASGSGDNIPCAQFLESSSRYRLKIV